MRRLTLTAAVVAVFALFTLAVAGPAAAHTTRIATDPVHDAAVEQGPPRVSATFNEPLQTAFASMTVVGPDGNSWSTGPAQVTAATVSVDLRPLGPVGTYTVNYRVTSADGHPVTGTWSFRLTVAGSGTPGPSAAAGDAGDDTLPVWPFVAVAVVIVGAGGGWAARRQIRRNR
jgi:copper resistance protein C